MQRLLHLKQASSNSKAIAKTNCASLLHQLPHTTVSIPTPQNPILVSPLARPFHHSLPWRSQHTLAGKGHGFISYPVLANRVLMSFSSTHMKGSSTRLADCRVRFLRAWLPKRGPEFPPGFGYNKGWRSWFQRLTTSDMLLGLIVANVAVFMLWRVADSKFMTNNFTNSLDNFKSGRLHTLITSAFSHIRLEHIASNMIGLYFFGMSIGRTFGTAFLLKLYLAGALGGSVFYLTHQAILALLSKGQGNWKASATPSLGASGAVNAIMLLDIFLNPTATLYFEFIVPVPAMLLGIFLIGKDMLRIIEGDSHISGAAHLGGAAVAAIAWARLKKGRPF